MLFEEKQLGESKVWHLLEKKIKEYKFFALACKSTSTYGAWELGNIISTQVSQVCMMTRVSLISSYSILTHVLLQWNVTSFTLDKFQNVTSSPMISVPYVDTCISATVFFTTFLAATKALIYWKWKVQEP